MRSLLPIGILAFALAACGGDDTTNPAIDSGADTGGQKDSSVNDSGSGDAAKDTGTTDSSTTDSGTDAAVDSGPQPVNGCTTFVDKSQPNDVRDIAFPTGVGPVQYSPNCMKIKAGQSVTWNGAFANHPLIASGGDAGNPIPTTSTGTTKAFAFPTAGTYGFACQFHGFSMFGAIQVVP